CTVPHRSRAYVASPEGRHVSITELRDDRSANRPLPVRVRETLTVPVLVRAGSGGHGEGDDGAWLLSDPEVRTPSSVVLGRAAGARTRSRSANVPARSTDPRSTLLP